MAVIELTVLQFFPMFQNDPPTFPDYAFASDFYQVYDSVNNFRKTGKASNLLSFQQVVNCRRSITNLTLTQFLTMFSNGAKGTRQDLVDFYFVWQNARTVLYESVTQTLVFSQHSSSYAGYGPTQKLTISQLAHVNVRRGLTVVQTYSPFSRSTGIKPDANYIAEPLTSLGGPNGTPEYVF
jgi:hypothetical protein